MEWTEIGCINFSRSVFVYPHFQFCIVVPATDALYGLFSPSPTSASSHSGILLAPWPLFVNSWEGNEAAFAAETDHMEALMDIPDEVGNGSGEESRESTRNASGLCLFDVYFT